MPVYFIPELSENLNFPSPNDAEEGLLALGGDLNPNRLISAYKSGVFPWYGDDEPIMWWSPDPRCVIYPGKIYISESMKKILRKNPFRVSFDRDFDQVIQSCAQVRYKNRNSTWINNEMLSAYKELHSMGWAHSVEVWKDDVLVGGMYGVQIGKCFGGESMFHTQSNASKAAMIALCRVMVEKGMSLLDCQIYNDHLGFMGAEEIPRTVFLAELEKGLNDENFPQPTSWKDWKFDFGMI